jgi:CheY-like chemotaxis protein
VNSLRKFLCFVDELRSQKSSGFCRVGYQTYGWEHKHLYNPFAIGQTVDLAFIDVRMPKMDGLAATETIGHLATFAVTAHTMKCEQGRCLREWMNTL